MTLASTEAAGFDRLAVEFLAQPAGGDLVVGADSRLIRIATAAPRVGVARTEIPVGAAAHEVRLSAPGPGPVRLIGWAVERREPGVIYENHGRIGAKVTLLGRLDPRTVAYRARRQPAGAARHRLRHQRRVRG